MPFGSRVVCLALVGSLFLRTALVYAESDGGALYRTNCLSCHQADGRGIPGRVPPLAGSDFLAADVPRALALVLSGTDRVLTVNGKRFQGTMPSFDHLDDAEVAAVLSWVLSAWGGRGGPVTAAAVASIRARERPARREPVPSPCGHRGCGRCGGRCGMMRCSRSPS